MSRADRTGNSFPERVYVSRENFSARGRSVENRGELRATLDAFDVAVVTPETMSVAEQIWLYAGTELLVGPHGAGLTNMIFSEDARVLEFLPSSQPRPTYHHLARLCGHDYRFLPCASPGGHGGRLQVDVDDLRGALVELVDGR